MSFRPSRARATRMLVATLVVVSMLTITLDYRQGPTGPLESLGSAALAIMSPFQKAIAGITNPIGNFMAGLAHLPSLEAENQQLRDQLEAAKALQLKASSDQSRLGILEDLLAIRSTVAPETIGASVIGSGVSNFEWSITIDKGSSSGVEPGAAVMASAGAEAPPGLSGGLVGRVVRVTPYSADVILLLDPDFYVAGRLYSSGESGLIQGEGDKDLRMTLVRATAPVRLDDVVSTVSYEIGRPGEETQNRFPPGIVIGRVSRILPSSGSADKYVEVRPTVDFASLEFVLVVVDSPSPSPSPAVVP